MSEISTEKVKIVEQQDISNECNENNINPEGEDAQGEDDLSDFEKVENVKNMEKSPQTNEEMVETVESQCSVLIKQNNQMILEKQAAEIEIQEKTTPQKKCEAEDVPENNSNCNRNEVTETKSSCELKDNSIESSVVPETLFVKENSATNLNHEDISSRENKLQEKNTPSQVQYADHVTYTQDGTAIYTDPETNYQYKWCTKENNWISNDATISTNPYENEHYKWCNETQKWIPKQSQVTETEHYKWDAEKNQWIAKVKLTNVSKQTNPVDIVYDIDKDGQRTYTDQDGAVFFWDVEKNAWFPKIDDDFMARYQMSYGFIDNTSESEKEKEKLALAAAEQKQEELAKMVEEAKANTEASNETNKQGLKRKGQQEPPKWFEIDPAHNTKVYVSNLPLDITLDEFADVMGKCGMIMRDPQTQKYKLKLYTEDDGQIKGDGLCDYIKVESVDLALKILDEYDLRGHKIRVQRAQFQMRGEYNPALKPKRKKKDKEKLAKIKEKLFDWRPEKMRGERSKHEKTVIIKNLFHPNIFEKEVQLILDYQNDLREECSKCGTVRKVVIYDRHSEGVAQINMSSPEEADLVIQMMHGRFFGKRQLTAEHWDGKTKYKVEETEEEIQKRLNKWDQYLETEENKKSELQQNENDIEKTINFEPVKKSKELQSSMGIQSVSEMSSVEHPETSESFQLSEKV